MSSIWGAGMGQGDGFMTVIIDRRNIFGAPAERGCAHTKLGSIEKFSLRQARQSPGSFGDYSVNRKHFFPE